MNLIDAKEITWQQDSLEDVKKAAVSLVKSDKKEETVSVENNQSVFGKLKAVVRKAVDCCIE